MFSIGGGKSHSCRAERCLSTLLQSFSSLRATRVARAPCRPVAPRVPSEIETLAAVYLMLLADGICYRASQPCPIADQVLNQLHEKPTASAERTRTAHCLSRDCARRAGWERWMSTRFRLLANRGRGARTQALWRPSLAVPCRPPAQGRSEIVLLSSKPRENEHNNRFRQTLLSK